MIGNDGGGPGRGKLVRGENMHHCLRAMDAPAIGRSFQRRGAVMDMARLKSMRSDRMMIE